MNNFITFLRCTAIIMYREFVHAKKNIKITLISILQPVIFWIFIGSGFNGSFCSINYQDYNYYLYPGILMMIILWSSIFSMISLIDDKNSGFLKSITVSPIPKESIACGKIIGCSLIALLQSTVFLLIYLLNTSFITQNYFLIIHSLLIATFSYSSLGFICAWLCKSVTSYHTIMMSLLMPLWLLSGSLFPLDNNLPYWLEFITLINPISYNVELLRYSLNGDVFRFDYFTSLFLSYLWLSTTLSISIIIVNYNNQLSFKQSKLRIKRYISLQYKHFIKYIKD